MSLTHPEEWCRGEVCAIHNPSHHMANFRWSIRYDRDFLVERHCTHGVGHPDPDSVRWLEAHGYDPGGTVHGCCAPQCCIPPKTLEGKMSVPTHYRGIEVPGRLRQYWNKPTGRWWRKGIDAKADSMPFVVEPGQVYADNDPRVSDRILRIESLDGNYAHATIIKSTSRIHPGELKDREGEPTRILLRRLYPNARGYRLLDESTQ